MQIDRNDHTGDPIQSPGSPKRKRKWKRMKNIKSELTSVDALYVGVRDDYTLDVLELYPESSTYPNFVLAYIYLDEDDSPFGIETLDYADLVAYLKKHTADNRTDVTLPEYASSDDLYTIKAEGFRLDIYADDEGAIHKITIDKTDRFLAALEKRARERKK